MVIKQEAQLQIRSSNPEQERTFEATIETQETSPEVFDIKIQADQLQDIQSQTTIQHQDKEEYIEISPMEGRLFDTCCEEYEDFDDEEAIEDVLVDEPTLGAPDCEQYMVKPEMNGGDECMKKFGGFINCSRV
ncbi:unnamed protein product [Linum trigynum]|uniref:Uncharacterized protein n=1 Tax=Linum trigynum TaxID=586398 RepID=A0AAV2D6R5_9ROSI